MTLYWLHGGDPMNVEESLDLILHRIQRDAPAQEIDFMDPDHAYTVWADNYRRMRYCGSCGSLHSACWMAHEHGGLKRDLYIVNAEISPFGIMPFQRG